MKVLVLCLFLACASAQYWPAYKYTQPGYPGYYYSYGYRTVAPTPLFAKTTYKTVVAEADLNAKTPADTNKFDLKQKNFDVVTPYAYSTPYYGYPLYPTYAPAPVATPVADAAAPLKVESSRKKRQVFPVLPSSKTFVNDLHWQSVDINKDGQPDYPVYPTYPVVKSFVTPYGYPSPFYPYTSPFTYTPVATAPVKVEGSRTKRASAPLPEQYVKDLKWKSVDANEDGFPDVYPGTPAVPEVKKAEPIPVAVPTYPYGFLPSPYYPTSYPYTSGYYY